MKTLFRLKRVATLLALSFSLVGQGSGVAPVLQAGADPLIEALAREYKLNQAAIDLLHHFRALGLGPSVLRMLARQYQGKPIFTR